MVRTKVKEGKFQEIPVLGQWAEKYQCNGQQNEKSPNGFFNEFLKNSPNAHACLSLPPFSINSLWRFTSSCKVLFCRDFISFTISFFYNFPQSIRSR